MIHVHVITLSIAIFVDYSMVFFLCLDAFPDFYTLRCFYLSLWEVFGFACCFNAYVFTLNEIICCCNLFLYVDGGNVCACLCVLFIGSFFYEVLMFLFAVACSVNNFIFACDLDCGFVSGLNQSHAPV